MCIVVSVMKGVVFFLEDADTKRSSRFRPVKSSKGEFSLLECSKPKSTQYKDKWAVNVFRKWQAAREKKIALLEPGSMFKLRL